MRYQHDCEKCKPLGQFGNADLYYCDAQAVGGETVLARYSDDGPDYRSGMELAKFNPDLKEAKKRAVKLGYIKEEGRVMIRLSELMATLLLAALAIAGLIAWGIWL